MLWNLFEGLSVQLIQFAIAIVLARIISPTEYETIKLLMAILAFFKVFVDSGFNMTFIQKQDRTGAVLFFNIYIRRPHNKLYRQLFDLCSCKALSGFSYNNSN